MEIAIIFISSILYIIKCVLIFSDNNTNDKKETTNNNITIIS